MNTYIFALNDKTIVRIEGERLLMEEAMGRMLDVVGIRLLQWKSTPDRLMVGNVGVAWQNLNTPIRSVMASGTEPINTQPDGDAQEIVAPPMVAHSSVAQAPRREAKILQFRGRGEPHV